MKAAFYEKHGELDVIKYSEKFKKPEINDDEVLVRIKSTSVNMIDTVMRRGYPGLDIDMPHVPGGDIAGIVDETGSNVNDFSKGDRVVSFPIILSPNNNPKFKDNPQLNFGWKFFGMHVNGSYAEYAAVPESSLFKIPENVTFQQAASIPIAGLTAQHAIDSVAKLTSDDVFMVWGGSGGVGTFAIQLAKQRGATVITTTSSEEKAQKLKDLGADFVYMRDDDKIVEKIKEEFTAGLDVVLDYVGPTTFDKSFALLRNDGKLLFCGMITGREVNLNIQQTYFRHLNIHGLFLGSPNNFSDLLNLINDSKIDPVIHKEFNLKDAALAQKEFQDAKHIGKIIINID